jgi:hypothetical protein
MGVTRVEVVVNERVVRREFYGSDQGNGMVERLSKSMP